MPQGLPGCLPWGVMQTYINDYLHLNKGFSVEMATVVILMFGLGGGAGVLAGGAAGQLLYNWCVCCGCGVLWHVVLDILGCAGRQRGRPATVQPVRGPCAQVYVGVW